MHELLEQIKYNSSVFPEEQLKEIINRGEEFVPDLLEILKNTRDNYEEILNEESYFAHIYAFFLLAQFKEKESYTIIMDIISLPDEIPGDLLGDLITEDLFRIIASVCNSNIEPIKKLIEDENIDEYIRNAGIDSLLLLFKEGVISKDVVMEYFKTLFEVKLKREPSYIWGALVNATCDIDPLRLQEQIKNAYKDDLVDTDYISLLDFEIKLESSDGTSTTLFNDKRFNFITDTIEDLQWWACFKKDTNSFNDTKNNNFNIESKKKNKKKNKRKQVKASKDKQRKKK